MVLGPSSSRLMKASSVFVDHVEVRDEDKKGVLLYGFYEKPELSFETNWSVADYMIVASYSRKVTWKALLHFDLFIYCNAVPLFPKPCIFFLQGFSLWLNKGSKIRMRWEARTSILNQLQVVMIKGAFLSFF
jgi:hypothetical protein